MKTLVELEHPPNLREFDQTEYKQMHHGFTSKKLNENNIYLNKDGVHIKVDDIRKLEQEEAVNSRIVALFVNYLNLLQRIDRGNMSKRNQCRCYFAAVNVLSYDKYYKKAKYEFLPGLRNEYRHNSEKIYEDFDKTVLVIKYDDRWMCTAIELRSHRYYITDFLAEDLSKVKFDEILEVVKEIAQSEFGLKYEIQEFYDQKKLNFISDCGIYILNYIYKCMNNPVLDVIQVKFLEKDLFRKQLLWLIFKMKNLKKKEVQMFDFPQDDSSRGNEENQYGSSRNKNRKSQGTLHMPKKSVDGLQLFDFPNEPSLSLNGRDLSGINGENFESLPSLHSAKGNNRIPTLLNSQSVMNFNANRFDTPHGNLRKPTFRGVSPQDSMIELPKTKLQEILDDFRKEVQSTIKKEKTKNKKDKNIFKDDPGEDENSEYRTAYKKKKNNRNNSTYSSNDMSRSMSSNNSSLPSIYRNGYIPDYGGGGYPDYKSYSYGATQSAISDSDSGDLGSDDDDDDDDDVSDMSLFAEIIKKAKKKDRQKAPDADLFNYSRGNGVFNRKFVVNFSL